MRDNNIIQDAINCITILKYENKELKVENEKLRALCDTYRTCYQAKHSDMKCLFVKYKQTLQDIKRILIINKRELEECLCNNIGGKILDLITKAESEG